MYLIMAIEHFPDSEPVTTLEIRDHEADARMLARCMRDEAKAANRQASIGVHPIGEQVQAYRVTALRRGRNRR